MRPFTPSDAPALLDMIDRNRDRFHRHGLNRLPQVTADVEDWIRSDARYNERMVGLFEQARCVGFVGVLAVRVGPMPEPGLGMWYGLDQASEGRGLATQGVRLAVRWYAQQTGPEGPNLPSLAMIHCRLTNRRSARLAQRLGLIRDPSIDYVRHDGGRSAPTMIGFSIPTTALLAVPVSAVEHPLNTVADPAPRVHRRAPR